MKLKVEQLNIHLPIYCYLLLLQFLIIKDGLRIIIYFNGILYILNNKKKVLKLLY